MTKKIAITGPESTGKSTLTKSLAGYYNSKFVKEFARDYLYHLERDYNSDDLLFIAKNQLKSENQVLCGNDKFLFVDTELINIKIWSLHKYGFCDSWILDNIKKQDYSLYLVCDVDIPWTFDTLRENPDRREYFRNWFIRELEYYGFPYKIISGNESERLEKAINYIEHI
ncbi:MAG: AAA family ATPase [Bacteroidota bacterium]